MFIPLHFPGCVQYLRDSVKLYSIPYFSSCTISIGHRCLVGNTSKMSPHVNILNLLGVLCYRFLQIKSLFSHSNLKLFLISPSIMQVQNRFTEVNNESMTITLNITPKAQTNTGIRYTLPSTNCKYGFWSLGL